MTNRGHESPPVRDENLQADIGLPHEEFWLDRQGYVPGIWVHSEAYTKQQGHACIVHPRYLASGYNRVTLITCEYSKMFDTKSYEVKQYQSRSIIVPKFMLWERREDFALKYRSLNPGKHQATLQEKDFIEVELSAQDGAPSFEPVESLGALTSSS